MKLALPSALARFLFVAPAVHWRRCLIVLAIVLPLWGWFDVRVRGRIDPNRPGLHMTDLTVYTEAGAAFFDGRDPYRVTNPRGWGYLYPPLFAMLLAPLHALDLKTQVVVWFGFSCFIAWCAYREVLKLIALAQSDAAQPHAAPQPFPAWVGLAALLTVALPAANCLQRGQVGILKLYLLLVGVRLVLERASAMRDLAAGLVLALAVVLKVTPALCVGCLLVSQWSAARSSVSTPAWWRPGRLALGVAAGLVVWAVVVPSALVGWQANNRHLASWWNTVAVHAENTESQFAGNSLSIRNQSLLNSVHLVARCVHNALGIAKPTETDSYELDWPGLDHLVLATRVSAVLMLVLIAYWAGRTHDVTARLAAFGLACAGTLVASPIARVHYFVLLAPAMLFVPWMLERRGMRRAARFTAVLPMVLCLLHYAWIDFAGQWGLLGLGTSIWLFASAVLFRKATQELAPARAAQQNFIVKRAA